MKKDIVKAFIAVGFIFMALLGSAYLSEVKYAIKQERKKDKNTQDITYYSDSTNFDFNLPVVVVDVNGNQLGREKKVSAKIQVYNDKDGINNLNDEPSFESKAGVKIRGNSTSKYPKKQYSLELTTNKGKEKDVSLLGMPKGSDWVLNGPFADKSLMRNYIALNTSSKIMGYAPKIKFCEVFVVDDNSRELKEKHYRGVYTMIEKIKRDDDRVDITKSLDNLPDTSFILAKDRIKSDDIALETYGDEDNNDNYGLNVVYPKKNLTSDKFKYMEKYISEFERVLYSDKFSDPINGYSKYIDVNSFVDYYIINEFFKNTDAGIYSTYIYKDYEEKIKAGPVWDFNKSLGNHNSDIGKPYEYTSFFMHKRKWFDRLMQDKNFANQVVNRYKHLRTTYFSDDYLKKNIDDAVAILGKASERNFYKWPIELSNQAELLEENGEITGSNSSDVKLFNNYFIDNKHLLKDTKGKSKTFEEEIVLMKKFITQRGRWMDDNIDSLSKWAN